MTCLSSTADQRLAEKRCAKIALVGFPALGNYSDPHVNAKSTLLVDTEAGDLSILVWPGDTLRPRTWPGSKIWSYSSAGPCQAPCRTSPSPAHLPRLRALCDPAT
jgi:hypothetical protein